MSIKIGSKGLLLLSIVEQKFVQSDDKAEHV